MEQNQMNGKPRNEKERTLQTIWAEVLNVANVGIYDDFFALGGTSKDLMKMVGKVGGIFEVSLQDVFSKSTIAEIAPLLTYRQDGVKEDVEKLFQLTEKLKNYQPSESNLAYMKDYAAYNAKMTYQIREEYQHIFLTGGNGFLACHMIERFLKHRSSKLTILVRERSDEKAVAKLQRAFAWYFPNEDFLKEFSDRMTVLAGDVAKDNFGLEQNTYDMLTKEVDAVFHVAGLLRHYGHWQDFYTANVTGTEHVIAFAKTQLKKDIHFISTMGTGYNEERGKTVLPFTELEVQKDSYAENYYLKSKMLAEKALEQARTADGLNVKIYRPGYLVQNYQTGIFQINAEDNAYFQFFKAILSIGTFPEMETPIFDFSFIDQAAEAIDLLSTTTEDGHIYHLFNPKRLSMKSIGELMIANGAELKPLSVRKFCDFLSENADTYQDFIANLLIVSYVKEKDIEQLIDLCLICDRTVQLLEKQGFTWKSLDKEHMKDILTVIQ